MRASKTYDLYVESPTGLDMLQWVDSQGRLRKAEAGPALTLRPMVTNKQIRTGAQWQNRRNRNGYYYWPRTQSHVWFESALEYSRLVCLDYDASVEAIAAQPFLMLFERGSAAPHHYPDFFAVHSNGDQVVYNVKPVARMTDKVVRQFQEASRLCAKVGWGHEVLHELDPTTWRNLDFLKLCRHPRAHPDPHVFEQILDVFASGRSIGEAQRLVNRDHPAIVLPLIKHLIWHHFIGLDLSEPLDFDSIATTVRRTGRCCAHST